MSAQSTGINGFRSWAGGTFFLDVTAAATEVDDTLDVFVQRLLAPAVWDDIVHFTQVLGNGGTVQFVADVIFDSQASDERAVQTEALSVGTVNAVGLLETLRVSWVQVDPGAGADSFTFSVTASQVGRLF